MSSGSVIKTLRVMLVSGAGKLLAFARSAVLAAIFGVSWQTDAFIMAQSILNFVTSLSNGLGTVLVPIRVSTVDMDGNDAADRYVSSLIHISLVVSIAASAVLFAAAPWLARAVSQGAPEDQVGYTLTMIRIFSPLIAFFTLSSIYSGVLNAHSRFLPANLVGLALNAGWLLVPLVAAKYWGVHAMAAGYVLGVVLQVAVQLPFLRRIFRYRADAPWHSSAVEKTWRMAVPLFISSTATNIGSLIERSIALGVSDGGATVLSYASQLIAMVQGIIVVPIVLTAFTSFSALAHSQDKTVLAKPLMQSVELMALVLAPITMCFLCFSSDIISIVYERGAFDAAAKQLTSGAFFFYAISLVPASMGMIITRCFYALQDTKTPLLIALITLALTIALDFALVLPLRVNGIALATAIAATMQCGMLFFTLRKKIGALGFTAFVHDTVKISAAIAAMAVVLLVGKTVATGFLALAISSALGVVVYVVFLLWLKEAHMILVLNEVMRQIRRIGSKK